jgi:hypothetical protein
MPGGENPVTPIRSVHEKALPIRVALETPPLGGKAFLLESHGTFILEEGPGVLITMAVTHAGSGSLVIRDGIPNDLGFWPQPALPGVEDDRMPNGRIFYRATAIVMGSWMLNAGFHHGLTVEYLGGHGSAPLYATIVWQPFRRRVQAAEAKG